LRVEERSQPPIDERRDVRVRNQPLCAELHAPQIALCRPDQNVEILPDRNVLFRLLQRLQLCQGGFRGLPLPLERLRRQARDFLVEAGHAHLAGSFRREPGHHVYQQLCVPVALFDPCAGFGGARRSVRGALVPGSDGRSEEEEEAEAGGAHHGWPYFITTRAGRHWCAV
jgi:hypothetical protein